MGITFTVAKKEFADNLADDTLATNIETWVNTTLGDIDSILAVEIEHKNGFWVITVVYIVQPTVTTLTWTNCTTTGVAPATDTAIDVSRAKSIAIQADSTVSANTATDIDVNVIASLDGTTYDTVSYAEMNIGDAEIKTMLVSPGVKNIKLRLDENASLRADVTVIVKVIE